MGRREEKREITKQDILRAAEALFSTLGYEQTSVDDIAQRANVAKGTFYYNFPSKVDVVKALQRASLAQTVQRIEASLDSKISPTVILRDLMKERAIWMDANRELARVLVMERFARLSEPRPDSGPPPLRQILTKIVAAGQEKNEFISEINAEEIARFLVAILAQGVSATIRDGWTDSLVERVDRWFNLALDGIATGSIVLNHSSDSANCSN